MRRPPSRVFPAAAIIAFVLGVATPVGAAAQDSAACMCTSSFATVTLSVVDSAGRAVEDAVVTVRRLRRRATRAEALLPGVYTIVDDMQKDSIAAGGETVDVTVARGAHRGRVTLRIGTTGASPRCRCHVVRLSGPERIVVP